MRLKLVLAAAAVLAVSIGGVTSASAATEFGDTCVGENFASGAYTLTTRLGPPELPLTAPTNGVVTQVRMLIANPPPTTVPMAVKILRSAGGNYFTVTSQMTMQVSLGFNVAKARMPVQAGERLALQGLPFVYEGSPSDGISFFCRKGTPGLIGGTVSPTPVGGTAEYSAEVGEGRVPLAAIIEPDADNDGFGDETQDACPQNATTQVACPSITPITLSTSQQIRKGSVIVIATTNTTAQVSVHGAVKLGKRRKATLSGGTQTLSSGTLGKFKLKFSHKLKAKLKELRPKKSLNLILTVSGTSVSGAVATNTLKIKLKGQAKTRSHVNRR
jgi:hypothetical protein